MTSSTWSSWLAGSAEIYKTICELNNMKVRKGRDMRERPKKFRSEHHTCLTEPTNSEVSVFEKHMKRASKGKKEPRILIIGSSPELRNLASKNKIRTTVVANDLEIIERTSRLIEKKNDKEEWLEGDITKLPFTKNSFDVVFGDHIISNAPPFNTDKFYNRIREILKKGGFAVMRSVVFSKTENLFEKRLSRHFRIVEKEFGKEGVFTRYFPIYHMIPRR